ncbi:MAG: TOBE domain-containing protein [Firmicutes bacterium]|nr:TOBE domain-containing protein [Bacillota bacterium]
MLVDTTEPEAIKGKVEVVEPLGDEILVHFTVGDQLLVAKFDSSEEDNIDEQIAVKVDPEKMHVFRADSGDRVS